MNNSPLQNTDPSGCGPLSGIIGQIGNIGGIGAVIATCGPGIAVAIAALMASTSPNVMCALCKALMACLASLGAALIVNQPWMAWLKAFPPWIQGCVSGLISGALSQLGSMLCDILICHKDTDVFCSLISVLATSLFGCLKGLASDAAQSAKNIINGLVSALGLDVKAACTSKFPPFGPVF